MVFSYIFIHAQIYTYPVSNNIPLPLEFSQLSLLFVDQVNIGFDSCILDSNQTRVSTGFSFKSYTYEFKIIPCFCGTGEETRNHFSKMCTYTMSTYMCQQNVLNYTETLVSIVVC